MIRKLILTVLILVLLLFGIFIVAAYNYYSSEDNKESPEDYNYVSYSDDSKIETGKIVGEEKEEPKTKCGEKITEKCYEETEQTKGYSCYDTPEQVKKSCYEQKADRCGNGEVKDCYEKPEQTRGYSCYSTPEQVKKSCYKQKADRCGNGEVKDCYEKPEQECGYSCYETVEQARKTCY